LIAKAALQLGSALNWGKPVSATASTNPTILAVKTMANVLLICVPLDGITLEI